MTMPWYARLVRDARAVLSAMSKRFRSCGCSLVSLEFFVLLFKVLHHLNCFGVQLVGALMFFHGNNQLQELRHGGNDVLDMFSSLKLTT